MAGIEGPLTAVSKAMEDAKKQFLGGTKAIEHMGKEFTNVVKDMKKYTRMSMSLLGAMFGLQSIHKLFAKTVKGLAGQFSALAWYLEDQAWLMEELGEIMFETLEPAFDFLIELTESFLEAIEDLPEPWRTWLLQVAGGFLLAGEQASGFLSMAADLVVAGYGLSAGWVWAVSKFPILGTILGKLQGIFGTTLFTVKGLTVSLGMLAASIAAVAIGFVAGFVAARMLINAFGPIGGAIVPLIALFAAVAVAALAMHGAITMGVAIPIILGAIAAGVAGLLALLNVPLMAEGGIVTRGGIVEVEPGEVIIPPGGAGGPSTVYNTFHIEGTVREEADIDRIKKEVIDALGEKYGTREMR